MEINFRSYGCPLTNVADFKFLGRILMATYYYWPEVVANLRKSMNKWARMSRMLGQEGENTRTYGGVFKAVVQSFLLFGS